MSPSRSLFKVSICLAILHNLLTWLIYLFILSLASLTWFIESPSRSSKIRSASNAHSIDFNLSIASSACAQSRPFFKTSRYKLLETHPQSNGKHTPSLIAFVNSSNIVSYSLERLSHIAPKNIKNVKHRAVCG